MKLAVTYDFEKVADCRREGLGVYAKHLITALMECNDDLELEFWTYKFNKRNLKLLFNDIFKKYGNRVTVFTIDGYKFHLDKKKDIYLPFLVSYYLKKSLCCLGKVFNYNYFEKKSAELEHNKFCALYDFNSPKIFRYVKKHSKADAVYSMFVTLKLGKHFNCPKFIQVHDLFPIRFRDLFAQYWSDKTLDSYNLPILKNLAEYAQTDTTFISSSQYTVREYSLKCIPGINHEQTAIIQFPPLVKDFNNINVLSKDAFKAKYGIWDKYIAVPCQNRPNKNWTVIFKAISRLKQKGINIQFVTTGRVDDIKSDGTLIDELGIRDNILEIGSISEEDLYMLYKYQDVAVGSTYMEGMGVSGQVIEALKVGNIPAVHSICCGIKESLAAVGLTMEDADLNWFEPNDDKKLAEVIEDILSNPVPHILKQKHIIDSYLSVTWENVSANFIKLVKSKINNVGSDKEYKKSFAQFGEDIIISELLSFLFSKDDEFVNYVDIGCNDPVINNNTYYFYKRGGIGVLVEPNPVFHSSYLKMRPSDIAINAGIKYEEGVDSADYYDFGKSASGLNTFSEERKNSLINDYKLEKVHKIQLLNINDVFSKMDYIDFVSIDVEGLEFDILKTIDFTNIKLRPKIFCIEANKSELECGFNTEITEFMRNQGYVLASDNFINVFFVDVNQIKLYDNIKLQYDGKILQ